MGPIGCVLMLTPLGAKARRVPPNLRKSRFFKCGLMGYAVEIVVLDIENAILQIKRPGDGRAFLPCALHLGFKTIRAVRRCGREM